MSVCVGLCVSVQSCDVRLVTVRSCSFKNEASDGVHNCVPNVIPLIEMPLNNRTRVHTNKPTKLTLTHTHAYTPWVMTEGSHLISVIRSGCIWDSITALSWVPSSSVRLYKALLPRKMPHLWSKSDYEDTHKCKEACTNRHTSASSKVRSKSDVPDSIPLDPSIR